MKLGKVKSKIPPRYHHQKELEDKNQRNSTNNSIYFKYLFE